MVAIPTAARPTSELMRKAGRCDMKVQSAASRKSAQRNAPNASDDLALHAIGRSGLWSVSIDATKSGQERWFLEISGPAVFFGCEVQSREIVRRMVDFLSIAPTAPGKWDARVDEFLVGKERGVLFVVVRDNEFSDRFFLRMKCTSRKGLLTEFAIAGEDLTALVAAMKMAQDDL